MGIPLWAIALVTAWMVYLSIGPIQAMVHHGDWPLPQLADIKVVTGRFVGGGGRRSAYHVQANSGAIVRLACIPESAGAECLQAMGYQSSVLPGKSAAIEYVFVRNYEYPAITNIMVSAVIDGNRVLTQQRGWQNLRFWKSYNQKIHWTADIAYAVIASLAWLMITSAWLAKLSALRRNEC